MMTSTTHPALDSDDKLSPATQRTLLALVVGGAAAILDSTIVTIALHQLSVDLGSSTTTIGWVITAYLLSLAVAIPLSGWAQSRFGGKTSWIAALTVFVAFSAACALSWNDMSLIVFRACQGFGAGLIFPLMQTLAMQSVGDMSEKGRGKAVVTITVPLALGPILGPVVGGIVLNWLSWRWMFLINVPVVLCGILLAIRLLPADRPGARRKPKEDTGKLDWVGLGLIGPGLVGVLLGLSNTGADGGLGHADAAIPLAIGIALLAGFIAWAIHRKDGAIVDISLLRFRSLATSSTVLFTAGATLYAAMVLLPLYWQQVRGASVLTAALLLIPQGVGALISRLVAMKFLPRFGARSVTVAAFLITTAGTVPFAFADANTSQWWLGAVLFVRGIGVGTILIAPMLTAYSDVSGPQMPHATMLTRITQQVGASFGAALIAVVLAWLSESGPVAGFHGAFWWATGITLVAILPALTFRPAADRA